MAWSIFSDGGGKLVAVGWAEQLLKYINAPVTPGNVQFVYDWELAEGGGGKYNPLNQGPVPGQPQLTTTGQQYGGGAADFASWQAGIEGAAAYLNMPAYSGVKSALMNNNPSGARAALFSSPWAASHYGYGSAFPNTPVPGGTPQLPSINGADYSGGATVSGAGYNTATCMMGINTPSLPLVGSAGFCIISKTEARGFLGGVLLLAGGVVGLFGAAVLVVYGMQRTGLLDALSQVAGMTPVGGAAKGAAGAAKKGASRTSKKASAPKGAGSRSSGFSDYEHYQGGASPTPGGVKGSTVKDKTPSKVRVTKK